ncbi:MAG: TetR family transcriptional regulator [Patulibacter sp.]|nr:TetR family transcriptional regulator [Patulibacter sp.]
MTLGSIPLDGLRERKKQLTRATIARVALDLFHEHGFHETTIAQIANASNVSPRTVSSYFRAKEDLVFPDRETAFEGLRARLQERRAGETAADAIREWIASELPRWKLEGDDGRKRRAVIASDPALVAHQQAAMLQGEQLVAEAIARDLDGSPDELEPRMAAAATFAIFNVLGESNKAQESDSSCEPFEDVEAAMALVERALRFVAGGIRALRDDPAAPAK